ncbi:MAG: hypothetical protein QMD06_01565 [Candidatus Altarchaeum sp.]|nr:hypothetical protein [Candidatus Altarchaeum sp.]
MAIKIFGKYKKITGIKSLKTTYNNLNNLKKLHPMLEFKKEKVSYSALGIAIKVKLLELGQFIKTK